MSEESSDPYLVADFLRELRDFVASTGMTQKTISSLGSVPRSTLSDLLGEERKSLPRPELLADVLSACGLDQVKVGEWESKRRLAARHDRNVSTDDKAEVERLQAELDDAVRRADEAKTKESRFRSRLREVEQEKQRLARELEKARTDSHETIALLSTKLSAAQESSDRLSTLVEEAARRALQAELDAANLRAKLMMTELELVHERMRHNERRIADNFRPSSLTRVDAPSPANAGVNVLKSGLHGQVSRTQHVGAMVNTAAREVRGIEAELRSMLEGASEEILGQLQLLIDTAISSLEDALRSTIEFDDRARQFIAVAQGQIAALLDEMRRGGDCIVDARACLERSHEAIAVLMGNDSSFGDLVQVMLFMQARLDDSESAGEEIQTVVRNYAERL